MTRYTSRTRAVKHWRDITAVAPVYRKRNVGPSWQRQRAPTMPVSSRTHNGGALHLSPGCATGHLGLGAINILLPQNNFWDPARMNEGPYRLLWQTDCRYLLPSTGAGDVYSPVRPLYQRHFPWR